MRFQTGSSVIEDRVLRKLFGKIGFYYTDAHFHESFDTSFNVFTKFRIRKIQGINAMTRIAFTGSEFIRLAIFVSDQEPPFFHVDEGRRRSQGFPGSPVSGLSIDIGEHPQRKMHTALFKPPYHAFRIRKALREELGEATVFLISHRVSTLMHADRILVMRDGGIAEAGTHEELAAQNGLYAKTWRLQSLPEEDAV